MIEKFQQDLRDGMTLEDALQKHHLSLKEAIEYVHKPITHPPKKKKPYSKRNFYKTVDKYVKQRGNAYHLRKSIDGKMTWGGSYNSLEEAILVRDFLEKNGWNIVKVREACLKYDITRRKR